MRKILVLRFSSLGDIILTTPVYRNLKERIPGCTVVVGTKEKFAGVLEGHPYVDRVLTLAENESLFSFIQRVRREKFDVLIDLHNNLRSNIVRFFSGISKTARYRKAAMERRLFVKRKVMNPELKRHTYYRYLDTLKQFGWTPKDYSPDIHQSLQNFQSESVLNVLVLQTAFLGDAVLTTPLFEALKTKYPRAHVTLLASPEIKDIFTGNKNIDRILTMDKRGKDKGIMALFKWAKQLKDQFDIAIVPHRSFRSAFLLWLARIPKRIGFDRSQGSIFLTEKIPFIWSMHDVERNMKLLEPLNIFGHDPKVEVHPSSPTTNGRALLREDGVTNETLLVGMNPGSVWKTKRWLPERFAEVADRLIDQWNCKILLFGSLQDRSSLDQVQKRMKHKAINLCGRTNLKTLTQLVSECSLFITNDSGPMHIACASQVPVVAIFGPTTRELGFYPYGKKSVMVEVDLSCRPCTLHGGPECPLQHFNCMKEVTAEMVLKPCENFLKEKFGTPQVLKV